MNDLDLLIKAADFGLAVQNAPKTIQYYHDQANGITYAVDVPFEKEDLIEVVHSFDKPLYLNVGESYVHPNDVYSKSTGRMYSCTRLKTIEVYLVKAEPLADRLYIYLATSDNEKTFKFRVNVKSDKPHLLEVY